MAVFTFYNMIRWFIETVYPTIWQHSMCNRRLEFENLDFVKMTLFYVPKIESPGSDMRPLDFTLKIS